MSVEVLLDGHQLSLSNLDKVLYPEVGFTKAEVIDYYARVAPTMVPHLNQRGLTFHRFPNGVAAPGFFEKRCPKHRPAWVSVADGPGDRGGSIGYCVIDSAAALVWAANPALSALGVAHVLEQTASGHGNWTPDLGYGDVDVAAAVARARSLFDR